MRKQISPVLLALFIVGCAGIQSGSDPVVVNAERVTASAVDTFDSLFKLEANNHSFIKANLPSVAKGVNKLRAKAPEAIDTARNLTKAYKENRNADNKANLSTALSVLEQMITEARRYITEIGGTHA